MTDLALEERFRIVENIHRSDTLVGAIVAVDKAVANEENPGYREYLDTTVRVFLEAELERADAVHREYLREVGIR